MKPTSLLRTIAFLQFQLMLQEGTNRSQRYSFYYKKATNQGKYENDSPNIENKISRHSKYTLHFYSVRLYDGDVWYFLDIHILNTEN